MRELSSGARFSVCEALDDNTNQTVTLTLGASRRAATLGSVDEQEVKSREALTRASSLGHPTIGKVRSWGIHDDVAYLACDWFDGALLSEELEAGCLAQRDAVEVALSVAEALAVAHEAGVVHGDLSAHHILLTPMGARIINFGFEAWQNLTAPHQPPVAPASDGCRSDVRAFGDLLYQLLSDQPTPTTHEQPAEGHEKSALSDQLDVPDELADVVRGCLGETVPQTFGNGTELLDALRSVPGVGPQLHQITSPLKRPTSMLPANDSVAAGGKRSPRVGYRQLTRRVLARAVSGILAAVLLFGVALGITFRQERIERAANAPPAAPQPASSFWATPERTKLRGSGWEWLDREQSNTDAPAKPDSRSKQAKRSPQAAQSARPAPSAKPSSSRRQADDR